MWTKEELENLIMKLVEGDEPDEYQWGIIDRIFEKRDAEAEEE